MGPKSQGHKATPEDCPKTARVPVLRRSLRPVPQPPSPLIPAILTGLALAAAALLAASCGTVSRTIAPPPHIPGAEFVGNAQCYECHTNYARAFQGNVHFRVQPAVGPLPGGASCESCHGPGSLHVNAPRDRAQFIFNPGRDPQACYNCHQDVHLQFRLPQHHPVPEGLMNCVQCHDPHGREIFKTSGGLAMARLNEQCAGCHREQARPFVFEHEALREGCVSCHQPHGAVNDKLLAQRDVNLCLKCHAQIQANPGEAVIGQVDHRAFLAMGTCWSAGCHTAVHGSNFHPKLLY